MEKRQLEKFIHELPILPNSLVQLMSLQSDDDAFFDKFEAICKQEPSLAIRVLKLSNSSLYASKHQVVDLKEAIVRLGSSTLINLFSTLAVAKVFVPSLPNEKRLWQHAIQVAFLAEEISKFILHLDNQILQKVYTCGLLHDIGLFVQFAIEPEKMRHIDEFDWESPIEHLDAESHVFEVSHSELGALLARKWQLPKVVELCIRYHHDYSLAPNIKEKKALYHIIRIIQLADFISEFAFHHDGQIEHPKLFEMLAEIPELMTWTQSNTSSDMLLSVAAEAIYHAEQVYLDLNL